tara:strand:+ start:610 stop:1200 length:591 start_codon:yes stop_codon:yes gene_type:complete
MKIAASILATNPLNLLNNIEQNEKRFDILHIDIADGMFCPTLGISMGTVKELSSRTSYELDVHLMVNDPILYIEELLNMRISSLTLHVESVDFKNYVKYKNENLSLGIGILPETDIETLNPIIEDTDFVLLLCVNPGFSNQESVVSPIERTTTFLNSFPDYKGYISVDGAVKNEHIKELENLGVKVAIQGSAIFDR